MGIQRNIPKPVSITNTSGQPEIVLEIDGLVISMTPPGPAVAAPPAADPDAADPAVAAPPAADPDAADPADGKH